VTTEETYFLPLGLVGAALVASSTTANSCGDLEACPGTSKKNTSPNGVVRDQSNVKFCMAFFSRPVAPVAFVDVSFRPGPEVTSSHRLREALLYGSEATIEAVVPTTTCLPLSANVRTMGECPDDVPEVPEEVVVVVVVDLDDVEVVVTDPSFCVQPPAINANVTIPSGMTLFHFCPRTENIVFPLRSR